jgi:hypothetical protein
MLYHSLPEAGRPHVLRWAVVCDVHPVNGHPLIFSRRRFVVLRTVLAVLVLCAGRWALVL